MQEFLESSINRPMKEHIVQRMAVVSPMILILAVSILSCSGSEDHKKQTGREPNTIPPEVRTSSNIPATDAPKNVRPEVNSNGNENELGTPMSFDEGKINIYIKDKYDHVSALNLFSDKIAAYHHDLWGEPLEIKLSGYQDMDEEIYDDYYPGLRIHYFRSSGKIVYITIDSADYKIQNDIGVGSTRNEVLKAFPNGFSTFHYGDKEFKNPSVYYYLQMSGTDSGMGYTFHFDEKGIVKSIEEGFQAFAP
jgi:hypothetical protein